MRKGTSTTNWIFPAPTVSGHIEASTLENQHAAALEACGVEAFVLYALDLPHSLGEIHGPFTIHVLGIPT